MLDNVVLDLPILRAALTVVATVLSKAWCKIIMQRFLVVLQYCRGQISLPHTSGLFVATNRVEAWGRVIQNQARYGEYSTDLTLLTFPNWLRRARAPTNCSNPRPEKTF